ncbi:MAG: HepT-like ribonuclease domain-containing protein [Coriobacteriia bacterium]
MTHRDEQRFLWDVAHHGSLAVRFLAGTDLQAYLADERLQSAVEYQVMIVGEAVGALDRIAPATAARLPVDVRAVVGLRNILAHGYSSVDHSRLYSVVRNDLPGLFRAAESLLADADASRGP